MQVAAFLSAVLIIIAYFIIANRPRFVGFSSLRSGGKAKERIVKIEKRLARNVGVVSERLCREIQIFNKMKLVMLCRHGTPVMYSQFLGKLVLEPRWVTKNKDGFTRLLYICAAANSYKCSSDALVRRQLLKNMIYVFGQKDIIKKSRKLICIQRSYYTHKQPRFKYLGGHFVFSPNRIDKPSYTTYIFGKNGTDKCESTSNQKTCKFQRHYVDKFLPVECFVSGGNCNKVAGVEPSGTDATNKFSYFISNDKFKYNISHTSDTFFVQGEGRVVGLYVPDKVSFGSSLCEKGNELNIYAASEGGKYYIVHGKSKQEVIATVGMLKRRRGKIDYLLTADEVKETTRIESLFECAWVSRFVRGDGLKDKFAAACKYVPTLFLPTIVYIIDKPDDFFSVVDNFGLFRKIAAAGTNLNIVFLYSSPNDEVREIMKTFADKDEAKELISLGVFLFFVDRLNAASMAVNYLSIMGDMSAMHSNRAGNMRLALNKFNAPQTSCKGVEVVTHISNSFPITHTVYARNTLKTSRTAKIQIPLCIGSELEGLKIGMPAICRRQGGNLQVTNLKSGRSIIYKLPIGATVTDEFGRKLEDSEVACDCVFVGCDVKLSAFEEKVLKIIKGEGGLSRNERKQTFFGNLENVQIKGDAKLQRLFNIGITDGSDEKLVSALKESIRNFEKDVFFALIGNREKITQDVYALLIERVIGMKLLRGKIQLMPAISITGSFELSFKYKDEPYAFKVKQNGSGFLVNFGDSEYRNFLQVTVN